MDKDTKGEGQESCCKDGGSCGGRRCCCGLAIAAIILLLLGGVIGYLIASHCSMRMGAGCPMVMSAPAPTH